MKRTTHVGLLVGVSNSKVERQRCHGSSSVLKGPFIGSIRQYHVFQYIREFCFSMETVNDELVKECCEKFRLFLWECSIGVFYSTSIPSLTTNHWPWWFPACRGSWRRRAARVSGHWPTMPFSRITMLMNFPVIFRLRSLQSLWEESVSSQGAEVPNKYSPREGRDCRRSMHWPRLLKGGDGLLIKPFIHSLYTQSSKI